MKIALVCDWLTGMRGGERCLEAVCRIYPNADIYTLVYYPENFSGEFDGHTVQRSFIQRLPGARTGFRMYMPLFGKAIESFDLSGYDVVVSFSHCVAKSVIVPAPIPHICYCHSPARYAWDMRLSYLQSMPSLKRPLVNWMLDRFRRWDLQTSGRPNAYIANSHFVQERIKRCYGINSTVIYPPVDCARFDVSPEHDGYYLVLSALVPYKRIDLAITAFSLMNKKLLVVGNGAERAKLRKLAKRNIKFITDADDKQTADYLANAKALIFPGQEDFGIVPLEAQACGKPVIAFGVGGALETVKGLDSYETEEATGVFFDEQSPGKLVEAVKLFEENETKFSPRACRANAERFDLEIYQRQMQQLIDASAINSKKARP